MFLWVNNFKAHREEDSLGFGVRMVLEKKRKKKKDLCRNFPLGNVYVIQAFDLHALRHCGEELVTQLSLNKAIFLL